MMPVRPWPGVGQEETKLGGKNASNSAFLLKSSVGEIARNEFRKQQWIQFSKKHFLIYWQMQLFCTVLSKGMIETNSHCAHESINLGLIANSGTLWNLSALVTYFLWPRIQVNDSEREFYAYKRCNSHKKTPELWTGQVKHIPMFSFLEPGAREWSGGRWCWWGFQRKTHLCQSLCMSTKQAERLWWTLTAQNWIYCF